MGLLKLLNGLGHLLQLLVRLYQVSSKKVKDVKIKRSVKRAKKSGDTSDIDEFFR